ncbi:MAG: Transcriptional regulatory protein ZraR [bacterium ADurb.Bin363]|nr:MAG: Transcriptional regulatory protein ZraR [bacterium ADurb.Bin363]
MKQENNLILVVEDEKALRIALCNMLQDEGYETIEAEDGKIALELIRGPLPALVITDLKMPKIDGMKLLKRIKEIDSQLPVIVITAYGTSSTAIDAIKHGAYDYITKPFDLDEVLLKVKRALSHEALALEVKALKDELLDRYRMDNIIGNSSKMQDIYKTIGRVAETRATVLIQGESGTGKELVANAIHYNSLRKSGPFIKINCAALPESLLESELFGHEKGSFTGAISTRRGKFEIANNGTIFLDEVSEMSPVLQSKLLRVLQDQTFDRVGGNQNIIVDVRVIAATNKNLEEEVKKGNFREDLYYRLNVVFIMLPPLKDRKEDIEPLIEHFLHKYSSEAKSQTIGISRGALNILKEYDWPGNVRELENVIERSIVFSGGKTITPEHLPITLRTNENQLKYELSEGEKMSFKDIVSDVEKDLVIKALNKASWNRTKAAEILNINRRLLYSKMKEYGISDNE